MKDSQLRIFALVLALPLILVLSGCNSCESTTQQTENEPPENKPPAAAQKVMENCVSDTAKFCKDVEIGEGRIGKCLKDQAKSLTPECREALSGVYGPL